MNKILLCILDGFGYRESEHGNATCKAKYISDLIKNKRTALLEASGESVGLPRGQFGNSEVGHLTIGSGQVLMQKLPLISKSIESEEIECNTALNEFISNLKDNTCHLMGLFSSGGVHSDITHFFWAIAFLRKHNINIKAHLFLDGRDVIQCDALDTLKKALDDNKIRMSEIATIQGRYFAMDRDKRMDRTKKAYDCIVKGIAEYKTSDPIDTISKLYKDGITDEFMPPIAMSNYIGTSEDSSFWMLNFRTDRIKQILSLLIEKGAHVLNMVECGEDIDSKSETMFPTIEVRNTLGEILASERITQLRIAETEKYAHVTYFFNGGKDVQYEGEDRILVPSPQVKDYSETPDMSSSLIKEKLIEALRKSSHQVIIVNFASPDMIGHTGNLLATEEALIHLDTHIKEILKIAKDNGYITIITADHGNAEEMLDNDENPIKTHTSNPVPLVIYPESELSFKPKTLADIKQVVLELLKK